MKMLLLSVLVMFLFFGCQKNSTGINNSESQIRLTTNKSSYVQSDTIKVTLRNNSDENIVFETRSGCMIMYYQKYQNDSWSDILYFYCSSLRGPSIADTLRPNASFIQTMPPNIFDSTGTFRLVVKLILPNRMAAKPDNEPKIFSNSFTIKKD